MKSSLIFLGLLLIPLSSAQFIESTNIISGSGSWEKTFDYEYNNYYYQNSFMNMGNSNLYFDYNRGANIKQLDFKTTYTNLNHPWFSW